jgi:hypothetical protein
MPLDFFVINRGDEKTKFRSASIRDVEFTEGQDFQWASAHHLYEGMYLRLRLSNHPP